MERLFKTMILVQKLERVPRQALQRILEDRDLTSTRWKPWVKVQLPEELPLKLHKVEILKMSPMVYFLPSRDSLGLKGDAFPSHRFLKQIFKDIVSP